MLWKAAFGVIAILSVAGCGSPGSKSEQDRERSASPAAQVVRRFYEAANAAHGSEACNLLTDTGIRTIIRVKTRAECVRTVDGFQPGSFASIEIEVVAPQEEGFDVDAVVKGRSEGRYTVISRGGRLLIDRFTSKEG